jgi:hypothetical protein
VKIDWQAYLDNSLTVEERERAEQMLKESPEARRELDGLKMFVSDVRAVALSEEVPLDRLLALMPKEEPKVRPSLWLRPAMLTGMAAAAALAFVLISGVVRPGLTLDASAGYVSDTRFASEWASKKLAMNVPDLALGDDAKLTYVHESKGKCCLDYEFNGEEFHVNVRPKRQLAANPGKPIMLKNGVKAYMGRGVRWVQGDYEMFIVGGSRENALELANRTSALLKA